MSLWNANKHQHKHSAKRLRTHRDDAFEETSDDLFKGDRNDKNTQPMSEFEKIQADSLK